MSEDRCYICQGTKYCWAPRDDSPSNTKPCLRCNPQPYTPTLAEIEAKCEELGVEYSILDGVSWIKFSIYSRFRWCDDAEPSDEDNERNRRRAWALLTMEDA